MTRLAWAACVVAACGGKAGPSGPANAMGTHATPAAKNALELWSSTLVTGRTTTLTARPMGDQQTQNPDVVATVTEATTANGVLTATVTWMDPQGAPFGQLPTHIVVSATKVQIGDMEFPGTLADVTLPSGLFVSVHDKTVCYGSGPPPGSTEECADVCVASLCIDPGGFAGGEGTFWPDYWEYERR